MRHERIPLILLTGFLGSGKTTLLNQLVQLPEFSRTLVIINEFGETSLDHLLVSKSSDEQIVELSSGCICCTIRGDLAKTLSDATWRFARNGVRQFDRVVIETTGLAEPTPILQIISNTPKLYDSYRVQGTVTVVDAVNGAGTLATHTEAQKQVAVADLLLLSKTDLATEAQQAATRAAMAALNPTAPVELVQQGQTQVDEILALDHAEPVQSTAPLHSWLPTDKLSFAPVSGKQGLLRAEPVSAAPVDVNRHNDRIRAYCYVLEHPGHCGANRPVAGRLDAGTGTAVIAPEGNFKCGGVPRPAGSARGTAFAASGRITDGMAGRRSALQAGVYHR
ncbi:MAG: GTP-binding protein [Rheinheimera sp.]|nr:GTP-binding protein [Rheinheimera sp.]